MIIGNWNIYCGLDSTDDGSAFGILEDVEGESRRFKRWGVVIDVLNLDKKIDKESVERPPTEKLNLRHYTALRAERACK